MAGDNLRDRLRPGWPQPSPHGWVHGVSRKLSPVSGSATGFKQ